MTATFPIRKECPPGACVCNREVLLSTPDSDIRILQLTREEESRLITRIENIASFADLQKIQGRMQAQLGIVVRMLPSANEVRTSRGISIEIDELPGLCKKTKQSIPTAIRRCFDNNPSVLYALLDTHDLLGGS